MPNVMAALPNIGKKKKEEDEKETGQKYNVHVCYAGRP